jgi:hypothetical protein
MLQLRSVFVVSCLWNESGTNNWNSGKALLEPLYLVSVVCMCSLAFSWCSSLSCGLGLQIFYWLFAPSEINGTISSCWGPCSISLNTNVCEVEVVGMVSSFLGTMGAHSLELFCLVLYDITMAIKILQTFFSCEHLNFQFCFLVQPVCVECN